jgi:hypothetical protein
MAEKHIDELREILAKAAARDVDLQHGLEDLARGIAEELGADKPPVWAEVKAALGERQVNEHFVMKDKWLRGDLVFEVAPDRSFTVSLLIRQAANQTHEVVVNKALSQSAVIDPPDEKDRAVARKKILDRVFIVLANLIRESVDLPE